MGNESRQRLIEEGQLGQSGNNWGGDSFSASTSEDHEVAEEGVDSGLQRSGVSHFCFLWP
jgi:hypothetical protein